MKSDRSNHQIRRLFRVSPALLALVGGHFACSSDSNETPDYSATNETTGGSSLTSTPTSSSGSTASSSSTTATSSSTSSNTVTTASSSASSSSTTATTTATTGFGSTGFGSNSNSNSNSNSSSGTGGATSTAGDTSAGGTGADGTATVGTTGGGVEVKPSAGCAAGNASPSLNLPANTLSSFPPAYDGTTPMPVVLAYHAAGNPNTQFKDRLGDDLEGDFIVLYPKSDGNGWADGDIPKIDTIFDTLSNDACIDENRIFATGNSSGAQFIVQQLCAGETRYRAVAPIASSKYCNSWNPVASLVIHGIGDTERSWDPNGEEDIVPFRESNGCETSSTEYPVDGCQSGGVQVDPGCVEFAGCGTQTIWCQHTDPQYGTSHHGIPCFADALIPAYFSSF